METSPCLTFAHRCSRSLQPTAPPILPVINSTQKCRCCSRGTLCWDAKHNLSLLWNSMSPTSESNDFFTYFTKPGTLDFFLLNIFKISVSIQKEFRNNLFQKPQTQMPAETRQVIPGEGIEPVWGLCQIAAILSYLKRWPLLGICRSSWVRCTL